MSQRIFQLFLLVVLWGTAACATPAPATPSPTPPLVTEPHLRVENVGETPIQDLVVSFPAASIAMAARTSFGNIASNQTTAYQPIPTGVYRYAAYEYTLDGATVHQPVVDWVGETPLAGTYFTYQISFDKTQIKGNQISLIAVLTDN